MKEQIIGWALGTCIHNVLEQNLLLEFFVIFAFRNNYLDLNDVTRVNTVMGTIKKEISSMDGELQWSTNGLKQKASYVYGKESAAYCTKSVSWDAW